MLIGGRATAGEGEVIAVENPGDETVFARVPGASPAQIDAAIAAARQAYDSGGWSLKPKEHRAAVVRRLLDLLGEQRATLKSVIVRETGCPTSSPAMFAQLDSPLSATRDLVDLYLTLPEFEDSGQPFSERINPAGSLVLSVRRHAPVGVVAAISAYNFPLFLNLWKIVPALLTGNTVVLRPSPLTPLTALALVDAAREAGLPDGVLNIVAEAGSEGAVQLTTDPRVDMVTFTGSNEVGAKVMAQAAGTLKRIQLELGGKSAQIYLPDSVERAAGAAASVCLAHAGQGCVLGTRVLVPETEKARVMEAMAATMRGVVLGDPQDPATQMGPVISAAQRARCETYVRLAVEAGAKVVLGGGRPAHLPRGYFFEPTILDLPDNRNPAAQHEIFGPVVGVIGYRSIDHAVEMANDTVFGLSGYVFGKDLRQAAEVAQRLRTGTVNVNSGMMSAYVSSGGWGRSGFGRERGIEGLRIYQQLQILNLAN
ncbi:MAG: aldehyde dehydrogenase family protein [Dehalococcoidia bacterium]|nr:aldehyde dehydrogenase family protein [Dehalococcoidia bacterium]